MLSGSCLKCFLRSIYDDFGVPSDFGRKYSCQSGTLFLQNHAFKKEKKWIQKIAGAMEKYRSVADYLRRNKQVIVNVLLITFVQRFMWFFITYLVCLSFLVRTAGPITVTTLQGMISVSVDMLPLPGGMGMSENLFLSIFRPLCGKNLVLPVMIVSRGISYYSQLIISAIMTGVAYFTIGGVGRNE